MFSNFSWVEYGLFTGVSLLVYYVVVLLLYYRWEMRGLFDVRFPSRTVDQDEPLAGLDQELMGKPVAEEGMSSVSMDELDFGGSDELMQGDLADCMEELNLTIALAREKDWDRKKLVGAISEIAESYREVFHSKLGSGLVNHICLECREKLELEISPSELIGQFSLRVPGWGKAAAGGAAVLTLFAQLVFGQDGNQGISEATTKVKSYFETGTDLMYAIGAIMGLVGAVKVYSKWSNGEPDTSKVATAWFGACIFLVVVATVLKSFFGI